MCPADSNRIVRHATTFRRLCVALGLVLWLTQVCTNRVSFADAGDRPNVVFILADDLGWADTTLYGQTKFHQTPHLARLAKRGMLFTQAYAASPLCSPTRSSILTGMSPARTGITSPSCHLPEVKLAASVKKSAPANVKTLICDSATRLKTEYVTLAEVLKEAGYATGHFGKWHLGAEPYSPLQQGFDVDVPHHHGPGPAGSYVAPWKFKDFRERIPAEHIEDRIGDEAVAFLEKNRDRPFFLNYWMFSVHAPFDAKKSLIDKHRARVNPELAQRSPTYAAMVESLDDNVGKLLDALDRLKLTDRTVIVFFSDNGGNMYSQVDDTVPTSNAPLRGGKGNAFDGGIRVPCVVCWPGITTPGSRSDARIQSVDFFPTILSRLKQKAPGEQPCDGCDFSPALRGETFDRGPMFTFFPHSTKVPDTLPASVSVHDGDWKLIRLFHEGERGAHAYRLYNVKDDIGEQHDVASQNADRVRQLDALIEEFLAETKAVTPQPNPSYDPNATAEAATAPAAADPLQGWKARQCSAAVKDGVLTVTPNGAAPFLGVAAGKLTGPATLRFRVRTPAEGAAKIEWLPSGVANKPDGTQSAPYKINAGDWQEVRVELPARGPLGIVRLYLPVQKQPVEIDWIELKCTGQPRRWDFE